MLGTGQIIQEIFNLNNIQSMYTEEHAVQKHEGGSGEGKHIVALHGSTFQSSGPNNLLLNNAIMWKKLGYKITIICQDRDAKNFPEVDDYIQGPFPAQTPKLKTGQLRVVVPDVNNLIPIFTPHKICSFQGVSCKPIPEMTEQQIQTNVSMTAKCLREICLHDRPYKVLSNFMILSGIICYRGLEDLNIPYDIIVPGAALRYVVMPNPHLWKWILPAFDRVGHIHLRTQFVRQLFFKVFKKQAEQYRLKQKSKTIGPGLDIQLYKIPQSYEKTEQQFLQKVKKITQTHQNQIITQKLRTYGRIHASENAESSQNEEFPNIIKINLLKKWLPYNQNDQTILYIGAAMDKMGVSELIVIFTKLIAERPRLKLIISGIGPLKQPLMQFIHALEEGELERAKSILGKIDLAEQIDIKQYLKKIDKLVSSRIIFTGLLDVETITKLMPLCTIYIAPGKLPQECNLSIIEALSFGLTPICNQRCYLLQFMDVIQKDYPELAQVARSQHDEFFVKLPTTIIKTLQFIKNNKLSKKQYRHKLRQIARRNFSWEHTAKALASQNHSS